MKERGDVSHDDIPSAYYCSSSSSSLTSRVDRASLFIGLTRYVNDERVAGRKARRRLLLSFFLHRLVCNSVTRVAAGARDLFFSFPTLSLSMARKKLKSTRFRCTGIRPENFSRSPASPSTVS